MKYTVSYFGMDNTVVHATVEADAIDVHEYVLVFSSIDKERADEVQEAEAQTAAMQMLGVRGPLRIPATVTFILPTERLVTVTLARGEVH